MMMKMAHSISKDLDTLNQQPSTTGEPAGSLSIISEKSEADSMISLEDEPGSLSSLSLPLPPGNLRGSENLDRDTAPRPVSRAVHKWGDSDRQLSSFGIVGALESAGLPTTQVVPSADVSEF